MFSSHCPSEHQLTAFALGELPEPVLEEIARHVESCAVCDELFLKLDMLSDPVIAGLRLTGRAAHAGAGPFAPSRRTTRRLSDRPRGGPGRHGNRLRGRASVTGPARRPQGPSPWLAG